MKRTFTMCVLLDFFFVCSADMQKVGGETVGDGEIRSMHDYYTIH